MRAAASPTPPPPAPPAPPAPGPPVHAAAEADRPGTLRRRLLAVALGALTAGLLASGLCVHVLLAATLVEGHAQRVEARAATLRDAAVAAGPAGVGPLLERAGAAEGTEVIRLEVGGSPVFDHRAASSPGGAADRGGLAAWAAAAAFRPPLAVSSRDLFFDGLGGDAAAQLTLAARDPGHAGALARADARLGTVLVSLFVLLAPLVVAAVVRLTAPLSGLREAVLRARRAGRTGFATPPPPQAGRSELRVLCRAIDALGADVADARLRLSAANEELTQQVKARTAELSQANRQLEVEAEDKDHFLRAVSHDLNAPLRNIEGLSRLLLHKHAAELPADAASRLERICINVKHQHELIGDLLELSRLRTQAHRPVELRLGELVDEVAGGLGFDLENAGIEFSMTGQWPVIHAERNSLRQVFQNLIDNAIKYMMDRPTRRITVEAKRERDFEADIFDGVDSYRFLVTDTGQGIAEQDVAAVFRVFSRSTHSGTHGVAGRGVGLACVEAIVRRYGGRVGVQSRLGEGSCFWFTLPVGAVSSSEAEQADRAFTAAPAALPAAA